MLIKKPDDIKSSEITPRSVYLNRRTFMRGVVLAASTTATGLVYRGFTRTNEDGEAAQPSGEKIADLQSSPDIPQLDEKKTSFEDITHYNNFYEFSTDKREVPTRPSALSPDPGQSRSKGWLTAPAFSTSMI